ncbi:MAG TPA: SPFH domain-containing protein [Rhizomicrobium sp.]|nr:SPFH domain-containing protein [Rhizomicrobium sp.]
MSDTVQDVRHLGPWGQAAALSFRFVMFAACAIVLGWLVSNIRQVPADSQAVVVRLGAVDRVQGPGLLLAWPKPIEQVVLVPSSARQIQFNIDRFVEGQANDPSLPVSTIGYQVNPDPRLNSGFLLTGDSSVVHLEARIFYHIDDPVAYMIAAEHVAPALERLFIAGAVSVVAGRDLDSILVARPEIAAQAREAMQRERLRADLMNAVNRRLDALAEQGDGIGIRVSRVDLVPSIPAAAKAAFDSVLLVSQQAEEAIATARTNAQYTQQNANQNRDRIMTDAAATADEIVSTATAQTASIAALASSNQNMSHGMLMSRLYYDRIGGILKKAGRVETVGENGTARLIVPGTAAR